MRDPSGHELSALLDPPLEGPGGLQGLSFDIRLPFQGNTTIRNGDLVSEVSNGSLSFFRVEPNGTRSLLFSEYTDTKTLPARYYRQDFRASSFEAQYSFTSTPDEQFYGAGQQACCKDHSVNKKGQVIDLINYNSHVPLPVFMSNKGYLLFFNMPSQGQLEFGPLRTRLIASETTVVDYWITTAPIGDYDALQRQYTGVTGRQPTPPDFLLGYQQSKLRYFNQTQIIDLAQRFHDEQVRVSLIVIDFFNWRFQGDWSFDATLWPDPEAMAKQVKSLTGAELMVSLWPSVEDLSENYIPMQQDGLLATTRDGPGVQDSFQGVYTRLVDSTNPVAREFLWKRLNDSYFSKGIRNFWIDQADGGTLGEPFENNGQNAIRSVPYARSFAQYFIGTQEATGKMYPWFHQQAIDEGLHNLTGTTTESTSCEFMSLTRNTFAGGQRFCSYLWSGDTSSRFDVLLQQVTAGVSVAASGISSWTLDIGGFDGLNVESSSGKELFVRWFAMGVFLPYTRVHGNRVCSISRPSFPPIANPCPNEPWSYGDDNFVIIKKYIDLRYQLVPYVKTLFVMLQATGRSIMRPLYYDFSLTDSFVVSGTASNDPLIAHEYMFGPRLLVAPVGVENATTHDVYLPKLSQEMTARGLQWRHWWTDTEFGQGGSKVTVDAPLDQIPVFFLEFLVRLPHIFNPIQRGSGSKMGFERIFIQPFGNHGIRVRASLMRDPSGLELSALLDPPLEGPGGRQGLAHDIKLPFQGSATIRNGDLVAEVFSGVLSFFRVEPNGTRTLLISEYTDAKALQARYYRQDFRASSFEAQFSFTSTPDEQIYGVGQQACCKDHSVNKKGQVVDLINYNSHVPLPVYMSNKGYLHFFNMPSQGQLEFSPLRTKFVSSESTIVDYWITTAPVGDYDSLQQQYTGVTGRQPTPPDFLLGYQQSKLRYYNQTQVVDLAQRFHDERVNVSLIVIDFFNWQFQGDWSFDPAFWPDPEAMVRKVKELTGAELMVSLWPSVEDLSENYISLQEQGLLASARDGPGIQDSFEGVYTRLIDSTNPDAREFLWRRLNESYFSKGIHNFWIDQADGGTLGEPNENNGQNISSIPYARSFAQYFIGSQESSGKMYPWFHQKAIDEGLRNLTGATVDDTSCEFMSLTRSTFAGGQRFCSYLWSGDTDSRFDVLLQQITSGVSVAASGISSWTVDIGGFAGLDIDTESGRELFVRWFAMGVFLPFTRVHGTRICSLARSPTPPHANPCPNEPWSYGAENFAILKEYIALRYQLIPYVKHLFSLLQATGRTIMRPLYYDFSLSDPFVASGTASNNPLIVHQYMFGPQLLVAPVGIENATTKDVYLPQLSQDMVDQGLRWRHWWSDRDFGQGGSTATVNAPLDQIPVFYIGEKSVIIHDVMILRILKSSYLRITFATQRLVAKNVTRPGGFLMLYEECLILGHPSMPIPLIFIAAYGAVVVTEAAVLAFALRKLSRTRGRNTREAAVGSGTDAEGRTSGTENGHTNGRTRRPHESSEAEPPSGVPLYNDGEELGRPRLASLPSLITLQDALTSELETPSTLYTDDSPSDLTKSTDSLGPTSQVSQGVPYASRSLSPASTTAVAQMPSREIVTALPDTQLFFATATPIQYFDISTAIFDEVDPLAASYSSWGSDASTAPAPSELLFSPRANASSVGDSLFVGRNGDLYVLLNRRSATLRSYAGDTSLPGGKVDPEDRTFEDTAIGLPRDRAKVPLLCVLQPFLASNQLLVTPVVVLILDNTLRPILNKAEVASLFSHPLESFLSTKPPFPQEPEVLELSSPDAVEDGGYHKFFDIPWDGSGVEDGYAQRFVRVHSFLTGREAGGTKPVFGLTAWILIHTATIGYQRLPSFDFQPPGGTPSIDARIAYNILNNDDLRRSYEQEGIPIELDHLNAVIEKNRLKPDVPGTLATRDLRSNSAEDFLGHGVVPPRSEKEDYTIRRKRGNAKSRL
ncbi:hypothetical protein ONZ45_g14620 [Pleurotus djamor]|nr:hypothetical protein ONZ45_g14620 [Pleurotus djamor]